MNYEYREQIQVYVETTSDDIILPCYAHSTDAGMDVYAAEGVIIYPGQTKTIKTGLKVAIPEGYEIQVRPRSGISLNTPLRISNAPGTIDTGFRDEIGIIITNSSTNYAIEQLNYYNLTTKGNKSGIYEIEKNNRIAQFIIQKVPQLIWEKVNDVKEIGSNRNGGLGSTGI